MTWAIPGSTTQFLIFEAETSPSLCRFGNRVAPLHWVLLSDLSDWFLWFPNMSRCCIPRLPRHTKAGNEKGIHELTTFTTRCLSLAESFAAWVRPKFGFQFGFPPSTSLAPLKFSTFFDSQSKFGGGAYKVEYWEQTRVWGPVSVLSCFFQV